MSKMKMLGLALAMASIGELAGPKKRRDKDIDFTPKEKPIPKGCKVYHIGGKEIIAISKKSAYKKYAKFCAKEKNGL